MYVDNVTRNAFIFNFSIIKALVVPTATPITIVIRSAIKGFNCRPEANEDAQHRYALEIAPRAATDSIERSRFPLMRQ